MQNTKLSIKNDGPNIIGTNFWADFDQAGKIIISTNMAVRILVPESRRDIVWEMLTAREAILSRGPWAELRGEHGLEILFEDNSSTPYVITADLSAAISLPRPGESFDVTIWTRGPGDTPQKQLSLPGRYRHVPRIPYLKPWSPHDGRVLFR